MDINTYKRKLTNIERFFTYAPFSTVAMILRIKGKISKDQFSRSISQIQNKHTLLRTRIVTKENGDRWFTFDQAGTIPVEVVRRKTNQQWEEVIETQSKIPFDFDKRPPIRFILIQSSTVSELLILCHHIICDGVSLAYLSRDLMTSLGSPNEELKALPPPSPIDSKNFPSDVSMNWLTKFFINRINKKWAAKKVLFNQADYESLNEAYWKNFSHKTRSIELPESQTAAFVNRCKKENVSVNTALTTAFVEAQIAIQGYHPTHSSIGIAANLRNRLSTNVGESMGFYAGMVRLKYKYDVRKKFWENARHFHKRIKPQFSNKNLCSDFQSWLSLDPTILEAINFKKFGRLVNQENNVGKKLNDFSNRKDVVLSILKRDKMDSFEHKIMGTAVTNLTRLDFPRIYGKLELDRMIVYPGGAFPLINVNLAIGAVTCSGKLSILMEYAETTIDTSAVDKIKERVINFLSDS